MTREWPASFGFPVGPLIYRRNQNEEHCADASRLGPQRPSRRCHRRYVGPRTRARPPHEPPRSAGRLRRAFGSSVERVAKETGACGIVGDVSRKEAIHPIALEIVWNLGGLDALINNASSLGPTPLALLADTECEQLEEALAVNLVGPFRLTKALFGALAASAREGRGAVIVNVSSDAAVNPYPGWGAYGASKAALCI